MYTSSLLCPEALISCKMTTWVSYVKNLLIPDMDNNTNWKNQSFAYTAFPYFPALQKIIITNFV